MRAIERAGRTGGALLVPVALAAGSLAMAEPPLTAVTPVFTQLVMFSLPAEFKSSKPTYEKRFPKGRLSASGHA